VKSTERPTTFPPYQPPGQLMAADVADGLEPGAWQRLSCGEGAQGERLYEWACVALRPGLQRGWVHALAIRRDLADPAERAYYLVFAPADTPLAEIVRAIGAGWTIEAVVKLAKRQVGLDQYEVRSWTGWHRHVTLALLALAALVLGAAKGGTRRSSPTSSPSPSPSCVAS
jgi:SRSO17 transposase